jgi:hypothetical protein
MIMHEMSSKQFQRQSVAKIAPFAVGIQIRPDHTMRTNDSPIYSLAFTAASLRPDLARVIAGSYLKFGDWKTVKEDVLSSNALQCRSQRSAVRLERELRQRLMCLTDQELTVLSTATSDARTAMAWLAAIKHIRFVFDFASEVLRAKLAAHDPILRRSDYDTYFDAKSLTYPELARVTASSAAKLRQVSLRMLVEANLLLPGPALGTIRRSLLPRAVSDAIVDDDACWLAGFLIPDNEIGGLR